MATNQTENIENEWQTWAFKVGDIITDSGADKFEITKRLIDADTGQRYYRTSHTRINASAFGEAEDIEDRHRLVNRQNTDT